MLFPSSLLLCAVKFWWLFGISVLQHGQVINLCTQYFIYEVWLDQQSCVMTLLRCSHLIFLPCTMKGSYLLCKSLLVPVYLGILMIAPPLCLYQFGLCLRSVFFVSGFDFGHVLSLGFGFGQVLSLLVLI